MARTEIKIELQQNPLNNHRYKYEIKDNGQAIPYINSDNEVSRLMYKKFIKKDNVSMGHFTSSDKNFVLDAFNNNAGFNGEVTDLVFIPKNESDTFHIFTADNGYITADSSEYTADTYIIDGNSFIFPESGTSHGYLVGVIGDFTKYTYEDNTEVEVNKFALIDFDKLKNNQEIVFEYTQSHMFDTSAKLNTIDYNSIRGELAIGGVFETITDNSMRVNTASNLAFFNVGLRDVEGTKTENVSNNGGFNGEVLCVGYGRGNNLVVSGSFTEYMYVNRGYIATVNTMGSLDVGFSNNAYVNGTVKRFHVTNDGLIYIVGEFTTVNNRDKKNLAVLNTFGSSSNNFNFDTLGFDVAPNDVTTYRYTMGNTSNTYIFVGGDFTEYDGNQVGNIVKFNTDGSRVNSFNTSGVKIKVNRLTINDIVVRLSISPQQPNIAVARSEINPETNPNNLYVSGGYTNNTDVGALVVNHLSGKVEEDLYFNQEVNTILIPTGYQFLSASLRDTRGEILYGGKFTHYDNTNQVLGSNEVEVGTTVTETLGNLYSELLDNNNNNNSLYEEMIPESTIKHTYMYFENNVVVVTDIGDEINYIKITVVEYGDDGQVISPMTRIRNIKPVLLRSDYIVRGTTGKPTLSFQDTIGIGQNGSVTSTDYTLRTFKDRYDNEDDYLQEIRVNKPRLSNNQSNTWVNISPLTNTRYLYTNEVIEDYMISPNRIKSVNQGMYGLVIAENLNGDNVIDTYAEVKYFLKGFKTQNESFKRLPQVLLNGDYREVTTDGKLYIPYNASMVNNIIIKNGRGGVIEIIDVEDEPGFIEDVRELEGYLMYFVFNPQDYDGDRFLIDFRGYGETVIKVRKRRPNCLAETSTIVFMNRWGILEHTQMIGLEDTRLKIESKDYTKSIRDINGNLINNSHSQTMFHRNAQESYIHSTGTIGEGMNRVYEDLVLSEDVWLYKGSKMLPVVIEETSFDNKTILRDKTVDYQFKFKEANNKIKNNI